MEFQISNYLEEKILDHTLRAISYSSPTTVYAALITSFTSDGDSVTEVSGVSYARQSMAFDAPSNGVTANTSLITFPTAGSDWGTATHVGIYDAVSAGNLLFWAEFDIAKVIATSAVFRIPAGSYDLTMGGAFSLYLRDGLINHVLRNSALALPAAVYAGIGTGVSNNNSSLSEPGAPTGYTRSGAITFASGGTGKITNTTSFSFTASGGNFGSMTHVGYFDAASAGNLLYALQLEDAREIFDGDGISFASTEVDLEIA